MEKSEQEKRLEEVETLEVRQSAMYVARDLIIGGTVENLIELAEKIYQFMIKKKPV